MRLLLATLAICFMASCSGQNPAGDAVEPPDDIADANDGSAPAEDANDGATGGEKTIEDMRAESLAAIDKAACDATGGEIRQEGMLGMYRCVKPYADAGKECRSKSDCEGECRVIGDEMAGEEAVGACQVNDSPFGCYATIEEGKVANAICVD